MLNSTSQASSALEQQKEQENVNASVRPQEEKEEKEKPKEQLHTPHNNSTFLSVSQHCPPTQKQQKQSSNDGLNSERSYPSSLYNDKDRPDQTKNSKQKSKDSKKKHSLDQSCETQNVQSLSDEDQDSKLKYGGFPNSNQKAKLTFMKLIFIVCKKQYAFQIIRIMMYALISITVFAYVLDQNKQKKQFYEAFYSSQQITISKQINGVFPPLFGSQNDIINRTWILQTYNSQLKINEQKNYQPTRQELLFQFTPYNVLYIKTNRQTCVEQLKFKWKVFDYNMRIYEVVESDFEKIQDQEVGCFANKDEIEQKMKEVSLWTIDWESKQLYLLSEPFRDDVKEGEDANVKFTRWNELIVLKKQPANV